MAAQRRCRRFQDRLSRTPAASLRGLRDGCRRPGVRSRAVRRTRLARSPRQGEPGRAARPGPRNRRLRLHDRRRTGVGRGCGRRRVRDRAGDRADPGAGWPHERDHRRRPHRDGERRRCRRSPDTGLPRTHGHDRRRPGGDHGDRVRTLPARHPSSRRLDRSRRCAPARRLPAAASPHRSGPPFCRSAPAPRCRSTPERSRGSSAAGRHTAAPTGDQSARAGRESVL